MACEEIGQAAHDTQRQLKKGGILIKYGSYITMLPNILSFFGLVEIMTNHD